MTDQTPPQNIEVEARVIGCVLLDNSVLPDVAGVLPSPVPFYRLAHQAIWEAVLSLYADGSPVGLESLSERLRAIGRMDEAGGDDYLFDVVSATPHSGDAVYYAQIVREKSTLRDTIEVLRDATREAFSAQYTAAQVLARASDRLRGVDERSGPNGSLKAGDLVDGVLAEIARRQAGEFTGIVTSMETLDGMTGGFRPTDFVLLAARPSMGKTAMALNIAEHVACEWSTPTLFVSLEMGNPSLVERVLSARSGIDSHAIRTGKPLGRDGEARLRKAADDLKRAPLYLVNRPRRVLSEVLVEVRRYHARHGIQLVIVDYAQLIHSDNPKESEVQALSKVSGALKGLANELEVALVALSQLNRNLEGRTKEDRRPRLSDLRGSGSFEQDADMVLFLHRPDYYDPADRPGEADAILAKNRNGRTGEFVLMFDKPTVKFRERGDVVTTRPEDAPF